MTSTRGRWWREPLLHFVLLGAGLFAVNAWLGWGDETSSPTDGHQIVITPGRVENLGALFAKTWKRPPTSDELRALVDGFVLEEVLFREGLAMGLDREDAVIRRRVGQKMEFVVDDLLHLDEPTDGDLEAWLAERPGLYSVSTRTSFRQVFLNPELHGERLHADAQRVLRELQASVTRADPAELGDRTLLHAVSRDVDSVAIGRTFGEAFARDLAQVSPDAWAGPIDSVYGTHLVFVERRIPGSTPPLAAIRAHVERDWRYARHQTAVEAFHDELLGRYEVAVSWPAGQAPTPSPSPARSD